ncbi:MAG: O-antigen ligase family protein [Burkholderiaceae bacterium]|nr:O-antigen ligase family protein [Burkholderiaceae bacterium]
MTDTASLPDLLHTRKTMIFEHAASLLTLLFAVSVFVWKPGIYATSGAIIAYLLVRSAVDVQYRQLLWSNSITKVTLAMFALGLVTAAIGAQQLSDWTWMARKTMFLPVIIFFAVALSHETNRKLALFGLITCFWIASILTLWEYNWQFVFGGRMQGTWPQGTWDNLLGIFVTFLVLFYRWTSSALIYRSIYWVTLLMAVLMLLLAGGRGPWLATVASVGIYLIVFRPNRKVLLAGLAGIIVATIAATTLFENRTEALIDRIQSIGATSQEQDGSNWVRLQVWHIGATHFEHILKTDPVAGLFGSGAKSYNPKQIEFFETMPYSPEDRALLQSYGYPSGDPHNTYIDSALRNGLVWTVAIFVYLIWLCTQFKIRQTFARAEPLVLLMYLCIMAMFYTVLPHFMSFFFALFVMMLKLGERPSET